jgi:AraC family transcriptional regulator, transcriptional activator of pobA
VPDSRNTRYFRNFQKSVKQSYTPMKSIKEYARELNITSVHLNRICQATVGKPALQIVHDFLILEAERFLKHTDLHVSEIAYRLNFDDPAYFSRFFKKYAGASPKQYREKD